MTKKPGLFKKILHSEPDVSSEPEAAVEENPFSPVTSATHLPPPRRPDAGATSHDPFEDDEDFGFEASGSEKEPETESAAVDPAFAIPEQKQMSQPSNNPVSSPPPASESESIRQLELRAIFGVDHEMGVEEILERSRKLKGIRHVSRLADGDAGTIEALKAMIGRLGLGAEPVRIFSGSLPLDFIREGNVALAVQTEGGFAPGARETLIIVARELAKM